MLVAEMVYLPNPTLRLHRYRFQCPHLPRHLKIDSYLHSSIAVICEMATRIQQSTYVFLFCSMNTVSISLSLAPVILISKQILIDLDA